MQRKPIRYRSRSALIGAIAGGVILCAASLASRAQTRAPILVVVEQGACPTPDALAAAIEEAIPDSAVTSDPRAQDAVRVALSDEGARYHVKVAGHERWFDDPARRCRERAIRAAVWTALIMDPPVG